MFKTEQLWPLLNQKEGLKTSEVIDVLVQLHQYVFESNWKPQIDELIRKMQIILAKDFGFPITHQQDASDYFTRLLDNMELFFNNDLVPRPFDFDATGLELMNLVRQRNLKIFK